MRTIKNLKLNFKVFTLTLAMAFSLTSCNEIIRVMDILGVIPPREAKLKLSLESQSISEPFSLTEYCKEEYDSVFLVYAYFNIEKEDFLNLKMSKQLRGICNSNSGFDSLSTILFVKDGKVKAYAEIENWTVADFSTSDFEKHYIFPFDQKFIMDKERNVHIYKE